MWTQQLSFRCPVVTRVAGNAGQLTLLSPFNRHVSLGLVLRKPLTHVSPTACWGQSPLESLTLHCISCHASLPESVIELHVPSDVFAIYKRFQVLHYLQCRRWLIKPCPNPHCPAYVVCDSGDMVCRCDFRCLCNDYCSAETFFAESRQV
jgi:hypothetical protein